PPCLGAHVNLPVRLLVDVRRTVDGELLDARRQRNGTANECTRAASRIGNVASCLVKHSMIESLQANPDVLRFHVHLPMRKSLSATFSRRLCPYIKSQA